jgi:hypothetical protein
MPIDLKPRDYDLATRVAQTQEDGLDVALISLSSPFGIESLPGHEAGPLLDAYHEAVDILPQPFGAWAGACITDPDPQALTKELTRGRVGLQLPATGLCTPSGWERVGELLQTLEHQDRPLLVHPGAASPSEVGLPAWWLPVVMFVGQMHAAWYAWQTVGRAHHPGLRVCFVGLAGLAPLHVERLVARGGAVTAPDRNAFFETSSYGARALSAMRELVGPESLVNGSDRPYATPGVVMTDGLSSRAVRVDNPSRLLFGDSTQSGRMCA